jgi:hypothetical protein
MTGDELKRAVAKLPPITEDTPLHTWPRHRLSIRQHIATDDPYKFLSWSTIAATMFVGSGAAFTRQEIRALDQRYQDIIDEPDFGTPQTMEAFDRVTSGNLIHQAYHLLQFERASGARVEDLDSIIEFGGGYGAMVVLCRRLGFTGRYTIIDLPEFSLLQQFYLGNTGYLDNVELIDDYDEQEMNAGLFLAIYSLSEVPISYRLRVLEQVRAKHYFLAHQEAYTLPSGEQVNNVREFKRLAENKGWQRWQNSVMDGHWYLCSR